MNIRLRFIPLILLALFMSCSKNKVGLRFGKRATESEAIQSFLTEDRKGEIATVIRMAKAQKQRVTQLENNLPQLVYFTSADKDEDLSVITAERRAIEALDYHWNEVPEQYRLQEYWPTFFPDDYDSSELFNPAGRQQRIAEITAAQKKVSGIPTLPYLFELDSDNVANWTAQRASVLSTQIYPWADSQLAQLQESLRNLENSSDSKAVLHLQEEVEQLIKTAELSLGPAYGFNHLDPDKTKKEALKARNIYRDYLKGQPELEMSFDEAHKQIATLWTLAKKLKTDVDFVVSKALDPSHYDELARKHEDSKKVSKSMLYPERFHPWMPADVKGVLTSHDIKPVKAKDTTVKHVALLVDWLTNGVDKTLKDDYGISLEYEPGQAVQRIKGVKEEKPLSSKKRVSLEYDVFRAYEKKLKDLIALGKKDIAQKYLPKLSDLMSFYPPLGEEILAQKIAKFSEDFGTELRKIGFKVSKSIVHDSNDSFSSTTAGGNTSDFSFRFNENGEIVDKKGRSLFSIERTGISNVAVTLALAEKSPEYRWGKEYTRLNDAIESGDQQAALELEAFELFLKTDHPEYYYSNKKNEFKKQIEIAKRDESDSIENSVVPQLELSLSDLNKEINMKFEGSSIEIANEDFIYEVSSNAEIKGVKEFITKFQNRLEEEIPVSTSAYGELKDRIFVVERFFQFPL